VRVWGVRLGLAMAEMPVCESQEDEAYALDAVLSNDGGQWGWGPGQEQEHDEWARGHGHDARGAAVLCRRMGRMYTKKAGWRPRGGMLYGYEKILRSSLEQTTKISP
jgi:hypothetical protein